MATTQQSVALDHPTVVPRRRQESRADGESSSATPGDRSGDDADDRWAELIQ